jgi:flagellar hook-length control protein FliK
LEEFLEQTMLEAASLTSKPASERSNSVSSSSEKAARGDVSKDQSDFDKAYSEHSTSSTAEQGKPGRTPDERDETDLAADETTPDTGENPSIPDLEEIGSDSILLVLPEAGQKSADAAKNQDDAFILSPRNRKTGSTETLFEQRLLSTSLKGVHVTATERARTHGSATLSGDIPARDVLGDTSAPAQNVVAIKPLVSAEASDPPNGRQIDAPALGPSGVAEQGPFKQLVPSAGAYAFVVSGKPQGLVEKRGQFDPLEAQTPQTDRAAPGPALKAGMTVSIPMYQLSAGTMAGELQALTTENVFESDLKPLIGGENAATSAWEAKSATPGSLAQVIAKAETPAMIGRQIAEAMQRLPDKPVELSLNPRELGRVKLSISVNELGITVNVVAERPETLDLMRRNIDQLGREFQSIGYENINFAFSEGRSGSASENPPQLHGAATEFMEEPTVMESSVPSDGRLRTAGSGLDLRL